MAAADIFISWQKLTTNTLNGWLNNDMIQLILWKWVFVTWDNLNYWFLVTNLTCWLQLTVYNSATQLWYSDIGLLCSATTWRNLLWDNSEQISIKQQWAKGKNVKLQHNVDRRLIQGSQSLFFLMVNSVLFYWFWRYWNRRTPTE